MDVQVRFEVAGATYTLQQMLEANSDDEGLREWLQAARPGDHFPDGLGCLCVAHVEPIEHGVAMSRADDVKHIRAAKVGEHGVRAGVWYELGADGEFAEVSA